ncbi:uncharacterized protein LOC135152411 isoform X1 [Daucus carota subsp. sativus]|uniref:uncharacterized protein LOC108213151 isoform X1 n=1 Tax=Daucus carota subsp. sativus TaxID=79200 RepID=UPI0007EEFDF2|nr:PREDICTED: uncharacterized protein LOC108202397 isoform X2 [Daucus carota subsp. sativus]XP_017246643.1 PREDICTED: uncharacterized protein LOC108218247 isoform X2 [Daucus carota subsp. sativus]
MYLQVWVWYCLLGLWLALLLALCLLVLWTLRFLSSLGGLKIVSMLDRGKVNAKIQSERCEDECDEAVLLKCGFRMLGADLLNDTKMLEINNGAKELNIPTSDANRKLVASDNGGLQNPSYLIFNPVWDSKGAPSPNKRFNYPSVPGVQKPISDEDIAFMTVLELGQLIKTKQISSEELTKIFLKRLKRYNPVLEAVITFTEELAYKQAKEADHLLSQGVYLDNQIHHVTAAPPCKILSPP